MYCSRINTKILFFLLLFRVQQIVSDDLSYFVKKQWRILLSRNLRFTHDVYLYGPPQSVVKRVSITYAKRQNRYLLKPETDTTVTLSDFRQPHRFVYLIIGTFSFNYLFIHSSTKIRTKRNTILQ